MLAEVGALREAAGLLRPDDFYNVGHQKLFAVLVELDSGDPVLIQNRLVARGELEEVGGLSYVMALEGAAPTAAAVGHYCRLVREKANLRRVQAASWTFAENPDPDTLRGLSSVLEAAEPAADLRPMTGGELRGRVTQAKYHIRGRLPTGLVIVAGEPGKGKSVVGLSLAAATAGETDWLGMFPCEHGPVLIVDGEAGPDNTAERWRCLEGTAAADERTHFLFDAPPVIGPQASALRPLLRRLRPALVVLDSFSALLEPGADENDNAAVRAALEPWRRYASDLSFCCALVHHLRKAGQGFAESRGLSRIRGAGALAAAADAVYVLHEDPDGRKVLTCEKMRWGPRPLPFALTFDPLPDGRLALDFAGEIGEQEEAAGKQAEAEFFLLECLEQGPRFAGELDAMLKAKLYSTKTARRARSHLKSEGQIAAERVGMKVRYAIP
jgi:hypothetical protein